MLLYMSADELANKSVINGECGEVVNTAGCGPVMRGFDPHRSPQIKNKTSDENRKFLYYIGLYYC